MGFLTKLLSCLLCIAVCGGALAQTIGGRSAYNFLKLPNTPQLSALGGVNISGITGDAGLSFNNPALLRPEMDQQLHVSFNALYAGIKNYHSLFAYHANAWQTTFALGVHFLDYGSVAQTDASGNLLGAFRPNDYVVQLSASRHYMNRWWYGASFKFISSNYSLYRSTALAMDAGLCYYDSARGLQAGLTLKNMGVQLKQYPGTGGDDLPFDVQAGISKRLNKAPVQFSFTAHHLHQFDILYADTSYNNANGIANGGRGFTADKLFRHFIFSVQVFVTDKLEVTAGYNYLQRKELGIANTANGMTGFSLGAGALFRKLQLRYARSYYQNNLAYNQFGLNVPLNKL
ncbi:MAG: type IX secretion system protein PorQ [Bacteroidetes bacterium]|nr:type IX secretion system protein PorQ [Bacteroidota bacterium]